MEGIEFMSALVLKFSALKYFLPSNFTFVNKMEMVITSYDSFIQKTYVTTAAGLSAFL